MSTSWGYNSFPRGSAATHEEGQVTFSLQQAMLCGRLAWSARFPGSANVRCDWEDGIVDVLTFLHATVLGDREKRPGAYPSSYGLLLGTSCSKRRPRQLEDGSLEVWSAGLWQAFTSEKY